MPIAWQEMKSTGPSPAPSCRATSAYLQSSLFTSVVAFGVSAMAILVGILFILIGLGIRRVEVEVVKTG